MSINMNNDKNIPTDTEAHYETETNKSLDNTSHPGRPGPDELVPSRYALKVGAIDVMVVSDGVLSLPGAMLGHNVDQAVRAAAAHALTQSCSCAEGNTLWTSGTLLQPPAVYRR